MNINMIALLDLSINVFIGLESICREILGKESVFCDLRSWDGGWERSAGRLEILELYYSESKQTCLWITPSIITEKVSCGSDQLICFSE